jgi:hypothetical protein
MMPKWENRPIVVANLLNPAFCGEILKTAIKAYETENKESFPYALAFIILPLILNKQSKEAMPRSTSKKFHEWLEDNTAIKINLAQQIKNLVPYTRESVLFLIYYGVLKIDEVGNLSFIGNRKKTIKYVNDEEMVETYKKAELLGRWLAKTGNTGTIYALIGIKP